ncbi:MAG: amidohydrolase family protein [Verrucomicrobia bacterium]|nr:amidohydrolase family protein [Verrucomicrobiota bacterium]
MYEGKIIDTHMHLWDTANGYSWLPQLANGVLNHNFSAEDYLKMSKDLPISQMIHIECGGFPENPVLETKWVQEQAERYGFPHAIIAHAQLHSPDVENTLKGHKHYPNLRGIRMALNSVEGSFGAERDDYMKDPAWRKGYALLSKYGLIFEMQIYDTQIADAVELARSFPDIPIVLQHLGWPLKTGPNEFTLWKNRLAEIAQCPNVCLKISCIGWIFQKNDEKAIIPFIQEGVRLFGVDRCMVGSNCPPDSVYIPFHEIFRIFKTALASYSEADLEKVFYRNAKKFYRI